MLNTLSKLFYELIYNLLLNVLLQLRYPMCLHFLDLLQYEHFRKEIANGQCSRFIDDQQILHWQHYTRKRVRLLQNQADKHTGGSQSETTTQKSV